MGGILGTTKSTSLGDGLAMSSYGPPCKIAIRDGTIF